MSFWTILFLTKMAHFRPIFNQTNQPLLLPMNDPPRLLLAANQPIGCNALIPFPKNTDAIQKRIEKTPQINVGINANRKKVIDKKDIPVSFLVHSYSLPIRHPNCTCDALGGDLTYIVDGFRVEL